MTENVEVPATNSQPSGDRLRMIRTTVDEGLPCLLTAGDIEWLVIEVECLRAELTHAAAYAKEIPRGVL